jgi:hypothetical protein
MHSASSWTQRAASSVKAGESLTRCWHKRDPTRLRLAMQFARKAQGRMCATERYSMPPLLLVAIPGRTVRDAGGRVVIWPRVVHAAAASAVGHHAGGVDVKRQRQRNAGSQHPKQLHVITCQPGRYQLQADAFLPLSRQAAGNGHPLFATW